MPHHRGMGDREISLAMAFAPTLRQAARDNSTQGEHLIDGGHAMAVESKTGQPVDHFAESSWRIDYFADFEKNFPLHDTGGSRGADADFAVPIVRFAMAKLTHTGVHERDIRMRVEKAELAFHLSG